MSLCDVSRDALRALYGTCFDDSDEFADAVFDNIFSPGECLCITERGEPVAAVLLPRFRLGCGMSFGYIYALCTRPDCRGRGLMTSLLNSAHSFCAGRGDAFTCLVPADAGLAAVYTRFGYAPVGFRREFTAFPDAGCDIHTEPPEPDRISRLYDRAPGCRIVRTRELWQKLHALYAADGGGFACCAGGYILTERTPEPVLRECAGISPGLAAAAFGAPLLCRLPAPEGTPHVYARRITAMPPAGTEFNLLFD